MSRLARVLGTRLRIFRLFGIDVYAHTSFLFALALFSWIFGIEFIDFLKEDFYGFFSSPDFVGRLLGIIASILLFASVLLHELSHSLVAKAFGMKVKGITLFLLGGVSTIDDLDEATPRKTLLVAAAGPLLSIVLGAVFLGIVWNFRDIHATRVTAPVFLITLYLAAINFGLGVFNLIPGYPLDGGRVFSAILEIFGIERHKALNIVTFLGIVVSCGLIILGLGRGWGILPLPKFEAVWVIIIGVFLLLTNQAERQRERKEERVSAADENFDSEEEEFGTPQERRKILSALREWADRQLDQNTPIYLTAIDIRLTPGEVISHIEDETAIGVAILDVLVMKARELTEMTQSEIQKFIGRQFPLTNLREAEEE